MIKYIKTGIAKFICTYFSFSLEGEDKILLQLLPKSGKYLDIGCSHPIKGNNTFMLYLFGWSGTCVDIRKQGRWWLRKRDDYIIDTVTNLSGYSLFDLLDLDVDGIEESLLRTLTHHPKWILVECCLPQQSGVDSYLKSIGYFLRASTSRNNLYEKL